jgi:nitroreductase
LNFLELANKRQSTRKYSTKPVEDEALNRCIKAAIIAPSASNAQPWKYVIVKDSIIKEKVARATFGPIASFNKFTIDAPVLVVIVMEKPNLMSRFGAAVKDIDFYLIDIGISATHFCLQATDEGLATCMIGWFNENEIQQILNIPKNKKIGLVIALGHEEKGYKQRKKIRKKEDKVVSFDSY